MLREVIDVVCVTPIELPQRHAVVKVQFKTGAVSEQRIAWPRRGESRQTSPATRQRISELVSEGKRNREIAESLHIEGLRTARGNLWTRRSVEWVRRRYDIAGPVVLHTGNPALPERYPDGRYSVRGVAKRFGVDKHLVDGWIRRGLLTGERKDSDFPEEEQRWLVSCQKAMAKQVCDALLVRCGGTCDGTEVQKTILRTALDHHRTFCVRAATDRAQGKTDRCLLEIGDPILSLYEVRPPSKALWPCGELRAIVAGRIPAILRDSPYSTSPLYAQ